MEITSAGIWGISEKSSSSQVEYGGGSTALASLRYRGNNVSRLIRLRGLRRSRQESEVARRRSNRTCEVHCARAAANGDSDAFPFPFPFPRLLLLPRRCKNTPTQIICATKGVHLTGFRPISVNLQTVLSHGKPVIVREASVFCPAPFVSTQQK